LSDPPRADLRDGSSVEIRPIEPTDRELLRAGFERLSEESRYRRFQTPLKELSDEQLSYLTVVDHHDHEALLALDPERHDAVGVARFVRVGDAVAECAIVVADEWQNRGLATELLDRLVDRAREEDIDRFTALVLADNNEALRLLGRLGDTVHRLVGSQVELEIALPPAPERSPYLHLVLAGVARGLLIPAISMWRQVADFAHYRRRRAEAVAEPANVIVTHAHAADDGAAPALSVAAALATARHAQVHLVDTYWPMLSNRDAAEKRLSDAADDLRRRGVDVTEHLIAGDIADAVIDVAEETTAALIVIDSPAAGGLTPWRASSLPDRVCARAPCDVLIARTAA
jgi:acetyltransferase